MLSSPPEIRAMAFMIRLALLAHYNPEQMKYAEESLNYFKQTFKKLINFSEK